MGLKTKLSLPTIHYFDDSPLLTFPDYELE